MDEGLSPEAAVAATLRDNLHGLEIDGRCVQIAAFAVALTAWRIGGWQALPLPNLAWVGAPPPLPKKDLVSLANGDLNLARALAALHDLFAQAPLLGSLIEPTGGDLADRRRVERIESLLDQLVEKVRAAEPERAEGAVAARGMADAAALLARRYTLQATNVPFLGRGRQDPALADHIGRAFPEAKADLATAMLRRMTRLAAPGGVVSSVTPQNWLFLGSYKKLREHLLQHTTLNAVAVLGEHGFDSSAAAGAFTALVALTVARPGDGARFAGLDANDAPDAAGKATVLHSGAVKLLRQIEQAGNPDASITIRGAVIGKLLAHYADSYVGFQNGDTPRWVQCFWEQPQIANGWTSFQLTSDYTKHFDGRHSILKWEGGRGELSISEQVYIKGKEAWGKVGS